MTIDMSRVEIDGSSAAGWYVAVDGEVVLRSGSSWEAHQVGFALCSRAPEDLMTRAELRASKKADAILRRLEKKAAARLRVRR